MVSRFRLFIALLFASTTLATAATPVNIDIKPDLVRQHFAGPGCQCELFLDYAPANAFDQILAKRWRELNPGFARVMLHRGRMVDAHPLDRLKQQLLFMKQATATEVYMTGGLREVAEGPARQAWAKSIVDELESLRQAGATNVTSYCATNELSLHTWGDLRQNLPLFQAYHQALFDELQKQHSPVKLLATDASPVTNWDSIQWAAQNMDTITGIYGGHHYFNQYPPDSPDCYPWFQAKCAWAADLAKAKGKDFILGEFGAAQGHVVHDGTAIISSKYFDTPQEPLAGLQIAEAAVAAINGGVYALSYWTFCDEPDDPKARINGLQISRRWGLFGWMSNGAAPRAPYYAYGLLTKFFHGPAAVYKVDSADPLVRVAAIQNESTGTWSIAIINRNAQTTAVSLTLLRDPGKPFRKYIYDPAHVPATDDGDLQEPAGKVTATGQRLSDTLPPQSLVVYTTAYQDQPPAAVRGLLDSATAHPDGHRLHWDSATDPGLCYYRVYQNNVRIGSTTINEFIDTGATRNQPGGYTVVAVDQSGNASPPQRAGLAAHDDTQ